MKRIVMLLIVLCCLLCSCNPLQQGIIVPIEPITNESVTDHSSIPDTYSVVQPQPELNDLDSSNEEVDNSSTSSLPAISTSSPEDVSEAETEVTDNSTIEETSNNPVLDLFNPRTRLSDESDNPLKLLDFDLYRPEFYQYYNNKDYVNRFLTPDDTLYTSFSDILNAYGALIHTIYADFDADDQEELMIIYPADPTDEDSSYCERIFKNYDSSIKEIFNRELPNTGVLAHELSERVYEINGDTVVFEPTRILLYLYDVGDETILINNASNAGIRCYAFYRYDQDIDAFSLIHITCEFLHSPDYSIDDYWTDYFTYHLFLDEVLSSSVEYTHP